MLDFDSLQLHSCARIDLLLAEAESDRLADLAAQGRRVGAVAHDRCPATRPTPAAAHGAARWLGLHPRTRLAASLYTLAVWLDPSLALALGVRPGTSSRLGVRH
jgi:hypothetical protein